MPLRRNLEEYAALDKQLAALAEESASLQPELDRLEAEQSKFKTAQRLFPLWQERKNLEETLHALPSTSQEGFLPDDPARLEHIEARQKNNLAALTRVQTRLGEITATLAAPKSNPVLLEATQGLKLNKRGYIEVDENGETSLANVFAGGDIVSGAATVILAMGAGRTAAKEIAKRLGKG